MKSKEHTYPTLFGVLLMFLFLSACTGNDVPQPEQEPEKEDLPIRWNVQSASLGDGRALIGNDEALQNACNPEVGNKAIGIWSAYEQNNVLTEQVLGSASDVSLTYREGTTWDNWNNWTYGELAKYWKQNVVYYFNAYYPQVGGLTEISHDKTSITGEYNTLSAQEDIMVCRTTVNTDPLTFQGSPIPLTMKHALAALCFQFQVVGEETMTLQAFSLNNGTENNVGLGTSATLMYQDGEVKQTDWTLDAPVSGVHYEWQHPEGVPFTNSSKAVAYQAAAETTVGNLFTGNEGFVLIIPQTYDGNTKMNFTVNNNPYQVELPTQEFLPGYRYIYLIKMTGNNSVSLTCTVQPWTLKEEDMNFQEYVTMDNEGQLQWLSGSVVSTGNVNDVYLNDETIQCQFHIATPEGATWYASLVPVAGDDMNAFTFVDGEGHETGLSISGEVGETATLTIKRRTINEYTRMLLQLIVKDLNGRTFMVHENVLGSKNYIWCQP